MAEDDATKQNRLVRNRGDANIGIPVRDFSGRPTPTGFGGGDSPRRWIEPEGSFSGGGLVPELAFSWRWNRRDAAKERNRGRRKFAEVLDAPNRNHPYNRSENMTTARIRGRERDSIDIERSIQEEDRAKFPPLENRWIDSTLRMAAVGIPGWPRIVPT